LKKATAAAAGGGQKNPVGLKEKIWYNKSRKTNIKF